MSKSVVISLGHGNLNQGFPRVTVQVWETNNPHREQFIGSLPPAPQLDQLYKNWRIIYQSLCDRLTAFAISHLPLYTSFQMARRQLQGLENEFPGASWLPIICQNPAVEPPVWTKI